MICAGAWCERTGGASEKEDANDSHLYYQSAPLPIVNAE
jgi:hypothetical protein